VNPEVLEQQPNISETAPPHPHPPVEGEGRVRESHGSSDYLAEVVVVGAGPAGTAVSILLAQQGHEVMLVDRATFPRDKPCAEYLSPACSPILQRLGAFEAVMAACPQLLRGMRVVDHGRCACVGRFVWQGEPLCGLALPRLVLDHLLVQQACRVGVTFHAGLHVRRPLQDGSRVCGVQGEHRGQPVSVRARLVIAADGIHSTLARRLGLVRRVRWLRHLAMVTHYTCVQASQPLGEIFLLPAGYLGLAPVGEQLMNVSLVVRSTHLAQAKLRPEVLLERTIQNHAELARRFVRSRRVKPVRTIGPLAQRTRPLHREGILFVGDAAGFFDPLTGQGIFLALRGAELAAMAAHRRLSEQAGATCALRDYEAAYRKAFDDKYRLSTFIQLGLRWPWLADRVVARLARQPALADTVVGVSGDFLAPSRVLSWDFARRVLL
jgi:flavin-dependent dehydrogenase